MSLSLSPLDLALKAARSGAAKPEEFYRLFLASPLFIPTWDLPKKTEVRLARAGEALQPVIIENGGSKYLMLFDSEARLADWAKREIGFVQLPGHSIAEMKGPELQWVLNVGSEYMHEFALDEIAWLKRMLQAVEHQDSADSCEITTEHSTEPLVPQNDSEILISQPTNVPLGILQALKTVIARNSQVTQAFMGQVKDSSTAAAPHLALVLRASSAPTSTRESIASDLELFLRNKLGTSRNIEVLYDDGEGLASSIANSMRPLFSR